MCLLEKQQLDFNNFFRMTLDLYGFVYTDRANFLFDGVGVGSAEQGH